MADCFASYKREDEARVLPIVQSLRAAGLSVWWDRDIPGGERWRETIVGELDAARCVLVCWSEGSVAPAGAYVREEAERAKARGVLLPVLLDRVVPPFGFGEIQALNLVGWKGTARDRRWRHVVASARAMVRGEPRPNPSAPPVARFASWGAGLALVAAALGFINDLAGIQAMTCRVDLMRETCRSLGWGGIPSVAEELAWQAAQQAKTCDAFRNYLTGYPQGAFGTVAQARLAARRSEALVTWRSRTQSLPLVVPKELKPATSEEEARAALAPSLAIEATRTCIQCENSDHYRNCKGTPDDHGWRCDSTDKGWRCGYDGQASCDMEERSSTMREICG